MCASSRLCLHDPEESVMTYYDTYSFRWTEREYTLRDIVEEYSMYLPFIVLVTEGFSSKNVEITADQIFWIHEITTRPCIVVRDDRGRYFSIPEAFKQKVVPLREKTLGKFVPISEPVTLSELKHRGWSQYFRLLDSSSEVFDGAEDTQLMKIDRLEIVDTFNEKLLAGYPVLSESETEDDIRQDRKTPIIGAIYPQVTLIPVYLPLVVTIALCTNNKPDEHFFRTMLNLRMLAEGCDHDYGTVIDEDAEIMVFNEAPMDQIYDYIQLKPFLKEKNTKKKKAEELEDIYSTVEDDSSDSSYEVCDPDDDDDEEKQSRKLRYRAEPVVKDSELCPIKRLLVLKNVFVAGCLPPDSDQDVEGGGSKSVPKPTHGNNRVPPIPERREQNQHRRTPPTTPAAIAEEIGTTVGLGAKTPASRKHPGKATLKTHESNRPLPSTADMKRSGGCGVKVVEPPPRPARTSPSTSESNLTVHVPSTRKFGTTGVPLPPDRTKLKKIHISSAPVEVAHYHSGSIGSPADNAPSSKEEGEQTRFTSFADIPSNISKLSIARLSDCLHLLGIGQHAPTLERNYVDGEMLCCLDQTMLVDNFGFNKFEAQKLVRFCKGWRPKI